MRNHKDNLENTSNSPRFSCKSPRLQDPETIRWLRKRYVDRARQDYILKQDKHHPESKEILEVFHDLSADKRIITMESLCGYLQEKDIQITNKELSGIISAKSSVKQQQIDITDFERIMMSATLNQKFTNSKIKRRVNQEKQQQSPKREDGMPAQKQSKTHKNALNLKESKRYRGNSVQNHDISQLDYKKIRQLSKSVLLEDNNVLEKVIKQDGCRINSKNIFEQQYEQSQQEEQNNEYLYKDGKKRTSQIVIQDEMDSHEEKEKRGEYGNTKVFKKSNRIAITNSPTKRDIASPSERASLRKLLPSQQSPNLLNLSQTPNPIRLSLPQIYLDTPLPQVSKTKIQSLESLVSMIHFERKRDAILQDLQHLQQSSQKGKTSEKIVLMESLIGLSKHSNLSAKRSMMICKQISENLVDPLQEVQINKEGRSSSVIRQDNSKHMHFNSQLENSQSLFINPRDEQSMSLDFSRNNHPQNKNQKYHLLSCNELIQSNNSSSDSSTDPGFLEQTLNIARLAKRQVKEDFRYNPPSISRKACSSSSNQRTAVSSAWSNSSRLDQAVNSFSPKLNCKLRLSQMTNSRLFNEGESQERQKIQKKSVLYNNRDICQDSTQSNTPASLILTNKFTKNKGFVVGCKLQNTENPNQKNILPLNQFFKSNNRMHLLTARQDKTQSYSNKNSKLHSSAGKHSSLNIVVEDQLI